ncbi:MAG: PEP-CTERM sorting domain-containing protein [Planctomycetes bacterium]|nr:PEP-CTERM sorting domain-containing protein [Planctomycetota bacterium]
MTHPVTAGLSSIGVDFQLPITTLAPSLDLTTGSGEDNVLSALGIPGTRAVFLSDTSQWSDEEAGSDRPITFGDNQLLLDNIVGYVPEPSAILLFASGLAVVARRRVERGN